MSLPTVIGMARAKTERFWGYQNSGVRG